MEEDDDDDLSIIDPSMGVTRVEVDPMVQDGLLLSTRLPNSSKTFNFWGRARQVFFSSVLTTPELEALRTGEGGPRQPSPRREERALVRREGSRKVPQIEEEEEEEEAEQHMGEEKQFSLLMLDEWKGFLEEEIALLKSERHMILEERLAAQSEAEPERAEAESSLAKLPKSPWRKAGGKVPGSRPPPSPLQSRPLITRQASMPPRAPRTVALPRLAVVKANDRSLARTSSQQTKHPYGILTNHVASPPNELKRVQTVPAKTRQPMLPELSESPPRESDGEEWEEGEKKKKKKKKKKGFTPAGAEYRVVHSMEESATPRHKGDVVVASSASSFAPPFASSSKYGSVNPTWTPWRSPSSRVDFDSDSSLSGHPSSRHSPLPPLPSLNPTLHNPSLNPSSHLKRSGSGVRAAMAAAQAAASGGKRIRRVWERMKRMVGPVGQVASGEGPGGSGGLGSHRQQQQSGGGKDVGVKLPGGSRLSRALRYGEIFPEQRGAAWVALACSDSEDDLLSRTQYRELLKKPSKVDAEISRDVGRTFPLHEKFKEEKGQKALFNVIKAYAVLDEEVGYCQGMGFMAATLLMQMAEEDAFCCLVFLLYRCGLRAVFLPDMEQLQVRLYQLSQLMLDCLPRLHSHLEDLEIKPVMYAADWFLTLFARSLPLSLVLRVFDIVFAEKTTAIVFKLGIVLLQVSRRQLLQCPEMEFVMHFLRVDLPHMLESLREGDLEELVAKALRVELPFEGLLRLEAEYELLAEEAAMAAHEVQQAAAASTAAAMRWEESGREMEERLQAALQAQHEAESMAEELQEQLDKLLHNGEWGGTGSGRKGGSEEGDSLPGAISRDADGPGVRRFERKSMAPEIKTTISLLRTVKGLRLEKIAVAEALDRAERDLAERLREENAKMKERSRVGPPHRGGHGHSQHRHGMMRVGELVDDAFSGLSSL